MRPITGDEKKAILREHAERVCALLADGVAAQPEVARQHVGELLAGNRMIVTPDADGKGMPSRAAAQVRLSCWGFARALRPSLD